MELEKYTAQPHKARERNLAAPSKTLPNSEISNEKVEPGVVASSLRIGQRFILARHQQNLQVSDVVASLKLSIAQVEALEADRYDLLPTGATLRGFIRAYAKFLKIEGIDELLDHMSIGISPATPMPNLILTQSRKSTPLFQKPKRFFTRTFMLTSLLCICLILFGLYQYYRL